jgi:hypothetical protein
VDVAYANGRMDGFVLHDVECSGPRAGWHRCDHLTEPRELDESRHEWMS